MRALIISLLILSAGTTLASGYASNAGYSGNLYPPVDGLVEWVSAPGGAVDVACLDFPAGGSIGVPGLLPTDVLTNALSATLTAATDSITVGPGLVGLVSVNGDLVYPCQEGLGATAYAVDGSGNHATLTGAAWSTSDAVASWAQAAGFTLTNSTHIPALADTAIPALTITDTAADKISVAGLTANEFITVASWDDNVELGPERVPMGDFPNGASIDDWSTHAGWLQNEDNEAYIPQGSISALHQDGVYSTSGKHYLSLLKLRSPNRGRGRFGGNIFEIRYSGWFSSLHTALYDYLRVWPYSSSYFAGYYQYFSVREVLSDDWRDWARPRCDVANEISFANTGRAHGWISINGERVYNIADVTADGTIPSSSTNWPDATLQTGAGGLETMLGTVHLTASGEPMDATHGPLAVGGGAVHNGGDYAVTVDGAGYTYADLIAHGPTTNGPIRDILRYSTTAPGLAELYATIFQGVVIDD